MKKLISSMVGGITGAVALNIVHQAVKQIDHEAPRVDLVGEEALTKGMESLGLTPPNGNALFIATLTGDILSNALYYSTIGFGKKRYLLLRGAAVGIAAGVGALTLTGPMGLSDAPVTRTDKTKLLTVAWYTLGGLVAASVMRALRNK
ncbi:hypothetical protein DIU31_016305 [Mucilaginibacter rubeus]|uniref:Uncharacterized protein n=1 Tax=Mucilaginibacter rubeus TaxID=2027860 RepID=A0AAE6MIU0_9SPHI|nr:MULTISPECIES: hypothetical protein [Mucilaginibacter]QEM05001.1 hypothetical protein DIU31_016305 [Mucilaginibacter rubeus]QEM17595.1 hypothetical protein DIU38_016470 [Mucilaginibacter gossypii]QTE45884.1 hypothetical protein J3L19_11215 [Mucilaginibacter rubeus]QTE52481.1 hypothetical protein J3L21_11185 [Mucilaginibacter rubeus]QTE57570.1 hypothetical protein J3L23_02860 [Mucilaginibacter rubeus]